MSFSVRLGGCQDGAHRRLERAHGGKSIRHALALEVRDRPDAAVLAHEEADAQRVRRRDDAQVLEALRQAVVHLHRVGDADLGLAAGHHRHDHLVAGGRLHQHIEAGFFLEHLGDRRCRGVVERGGLQRGEAVGLRRDRLRGQRERGKRDEGDDQSARGRQSDISDRGFHETHSSRRFLSRGPDEPAVPRPMPPRRYLHAVADNARLLTAHPGWVTNRWAGSVP